MRRSTILLPALAVTVLLGGATGAAATTIPGDPAGSGPVDADAERRVEAALTALDEVATEAGFVGDGAVGSINDPAGVGSTDDPNPMTACLAEFSGTVAEDGTLTGQIAGSESPTYYQADGDTIPDDGSQYELDQIDGTAAIVDADAVAALTAMVEGFGGDELGECMSDAVTQLADESDVDDFSFEFDAGSLEVGDTSSLLTLTLGGTFDGEEEGVTSTFAMAIDGDAIAIVTILSEDGDPATDVVTDALAAMIDAMAA